MLYLDLHGLLRRIHPLTQAVDQQRILRAGNVVVRHFDVESPVVVTDSYAFIRTEATDRLLDGIEGAAAENRLRPLAEPLHWAEISALVDTQESAVGVDADRAGEDVALQDLYPVVKDDRVVGIGEMDVPSPT